MSILLAEGSVDRNISQDEQKQYLQQALQTIGGEQQRVLLLPPDHTRFYSGAGPITDLLYEMLSPTAAVDIMPALGTHSAMTEAQLRMMFGDRIPLERFVVHDWRNSLKHLGDVPGALVKEWSGGKVDYNVRIEINERLLDNYDLILSIGQIVPHEVVGMANYTKNLCVGVGGSDTINKSHFLGAVCNMETIMGRADSPPRRVFNYGYNQYMQDLPVWFVLTVMEQEPGTENMMMRGLYIGDDDVTFETGVQLSQQVNLNFLDAPQKKVVTYLPPHEFKSTWLGNKAIYRTRMMIADAGELIVLAPGLEEFGEDAEIDRLIRKYGYRGTPQTLQSVNAEQDLGNNLSAAAHLIHGSSEGRFTITYCPGDGVSRTEIEGVGFNYGDLNEMLQRYPIDELADGPNTMPDGEEIYYISNPSLGLWALRSKFE